MLSPEQVEEWFEYGLRIIGPAHYGVSPYAHGTGTEGGLFERGPALLKAMERVGMLLDVTHLSDQCFDEALDILRSDEIEDMRKDDTRQCTRDLLLVERAREWLLADGGG